MKLPTIKGFHILKGINARLARREKIAVYAGACFVALFLILKLAVFPVFSSKDRLESRVATDRKELQEMMALSAEFNAVKGDSGSIDQRLNARGKGFNLFSLLEGVATQAGLKDNIKYIKPSSSQLEGEYTISSVEMQFEQITMKQLFAYLHKVENPANVIWVDRLSIRKDDKKPGHVDVTLQISTLEST